MKKDRSVWTQLITILVIGLVVSFVLGDFHFGALADILGEADLEVLLEYLSLGLGFLSLTLILVFLVIRAARGEKGWRLKTGDEEGEQD